MEGFCYNWLVPDQPNLPGKEREKEREREREREREKAIFFFMLQFIFFHKNRSHSQVRAAKDQSAFTFTVGLTNGVLASPYLCCDWLGRVWTEGVKRRKEKDNKTDRKGGGNKVKRIKNKTQDGKLVYFPLLLPFLPHHVGFN